MFREVRIVPRREVRRRGNDVGSAGFQDVFHLGVGVGVREGVKDSAEACCLIVEGRIGSVDIVGCDEAFQR